eukprot:4880-Heterococcus_DN1.PRE.2
MTQAEAGPRVFILIDDVITTGLSLAAEPCADAVLVCSGIMYPARRVLVSVSSDVGKHDYTMLAVQMTPLSCHVTCLTTLAHYRHQSA